MAGATRGLHEFLARAVRNTRSAIRGLRECIGGEKYCAAKQDAIDDASRHMTLLQNGIFGLLGDAQSKAYSKVVKSLSRQTHSPQSPSTNCQVARKVVTLAHLTDRSSDMHASNAMRENWQQAENGFAYVQR